MFVFDSIFNTKTTEPFWFKTIRVIISLILAIILTMYAVILIREFLVRADTPGVLISQKKLYYSVPSMKFCLKTNKFRMEILEVLKH